MKEPAATGKKKLSASCPSPLQWFPLATQQLRLRSVSEVCVYHPRSGPGPEDQEYHLTFHSTPLSPPLYTSPPCRPLDSWLTWPDLEQKLEEFGGVRSVIVRLWRSSQAITVWGVAFSGLVCLGEKISRSVAASLQPESFVFRLHQHYFVSNQSLAQPLRQERFLEVPYMTVDSCKSSYDRESLTNLTARLRKMNQLELQNNRVKKDISSRLEAGPSMGRYLSETTLRQQIFSVQPKHPATKMAELGLTVKIENTKFRLDLLRAERNRIKREIQIKLEVKQKILEGGDEVNNSLMENYHSLSKDREKLEAWLQTFQDSRDCNKKTREGLRLRRNQLISGLREIFPIHDPLSALPTICHVVVPSSDNLKERDVTDLSVGLGWVSHLTLMVSALLGVPLKYQILPGGSRSNITDLILDSFPDKKREFPLFAKGSEEYRLEYGVYLLNKNIAQLRWFCGLTTPDWKVTLRNLAGLLDSCTQNMGDLSVSPSESSPARHRLPPAPPAASHRAGSSSELEPDMKNNKADQVEDSNSSTEDNEGDTEDKITDSEQICDDKTEDLVLVDVMNSDQDICIETGAVSVEEAGKTSPGLRSLGEEEEPVEEAVEAADIFWDSVADRTEALAVPNTFKRQLSRPF